MKNIGDEKEGTGEARSKRNFVETTLTHFSGKLKQSPRKSKIPALSPEVSAFFKPFFLTMKLAPIKKLEERARTKPLILSEDIPSRQLGVCSVAMAERNPNF